MPVAGTMEMAAAPAPVPASITPHAGANDVAATTPPRAPAPAATPGPPDLRTVTIASDDPTRITAPHWRRILDGELYAAASRVEWAVLLRRTYGVDALRCPKCTARMRVMAIRVDPGVVKKILHPLGLPTEPPSRARARDPTGQESVDFDAAEGVRRRLREADAGSCTRAQGRRSVRGDRLRRRRRPPCAARGARGRPAAGCRGRV